MAYIETGDSVKLYYEESGAGFPIVFVHEFAGDCRSWEPQIRYFSRRYRCIVFNARGFPPSDVPDDPAMYHQDRARDDIKAVLDGLGIAKAHVVGISMGGFATLHFGFAYPDMARSLVVAGCGYGAEPGQRDAFRQQAETAAARFESEGTEKFAETYALGPTRVQFQNKDPRGWREFADMLGQHSATGSALTMRGVQKERPSLWELQDKMNALRVPTLIVTGDEDDPCLLPALFMKQAIASSGLLVLPRTGHNVNLEEPAAFNQGISEFLGQVEAERWAERDPRSMTASILGTGEA